MSTDSDKPVVPPATPPSRFAYQRPRATPTSAKPPLTDPEQAPPSAPHLPPRKERQGRDKNGKTREKQKTKAERKRDQQKLEAMRARRERERTPDMLDYPCEACRRTDAPLVVWRKSGPGARDGKWRCPECDQRFRTEHGLDY